MVASWLHEQGRRATEEDNLRVGNVAAAVEGLESRSMDELAVAVAWDTFCWCQNTFCHRTSEAWWAFGASMHISVPRHEDIIVTALELYNYLASLLMPF